MATIRPRLHLIDRKAPDAHSPCRCWETQVSVALAALGPRGTFWGASSSKGVGWGSQEGNSCSQLLAPPEPDERHTVRSPA